VAVTPQPDPLETAIEAATERIKGLGGSYRAIAGLAVRAAAPHIEADALLQAAESLLEVRDELIEKFGHSQPRQDGRIGGIEEAATRLRIRAEGIEGL
jgi:hypothetical protein